MALLNFESPLAWPADWPVTPRGRTRDDHGFAAMDLAEAIKYLEPELQGIQASVAVLSLDVEQPMVPRLRKKTGSRSGASLRFKCFGRTYLLACDCWQAIEHNIYALHLALRQWRNMERWGVGNMPVLLAGFETERTISTTGKASMEPWMAALGLGPTATLEDAIAIYHRRARQAGQDEDALTQLNILMEEVRGYFGGKG